MITQQDLHSLAIWMIEEHGPAARRYADLAVGEMQALDDARGEQHWRALGEFIGEMLSGRLDAAAPPTQH